MFNGRFTSMLLVLAVSSFFRLAAASPCDREEKECPASALNLLQSKFEVSSAEKAEEVDAQDSTDTVARGAASFSVTGSFTLAAGATNDKLIEKEEVVRGSELVKHPKKKTHQRGWFACKVKKVPAPSEDDADSNIDVVETVSCTRPVPLDELCCSRWKNGDFDQSGLMDFRADQNVSADDSEVGTEVLKVCTVAVIPEPHLSAVSEPVECIHKDFLLSPRKDLSIMELRGESGGLQVGELVLRERLLWLQEAGSPMAAVPKCADLDITCDDGKPPVTVSEEWLKENSE